VKIGPHRWVKVDAAFASVIAHVGASLDPQTADKYRLTWQHLETFLADFGVRNLHDIRAEHIASFAAWYQALGRAPAGEIKTARGEV